MSLYRRGTIFYIKVRHPQTGQTIRRSTGTSDRREAQRLHDELKARLWRERHYGPDPVWQDAVVRWIEERNTKRSFRDDIQRLRWLDQYLRGVRLRDITRERTEEIISKKQGVTPATRNRYRALIRAILRAAQREWGWLEKAPVIRMEPEPGRRVRFLTKEQARLVISYLPPHLQAMARFAVATGIRAGNLKALRWDQIDLDRRCMWLDETKNSEPLGVYLNRAAVEVLRQQAGKHPVHVFTYRGRPISQVNTKAWRNALRKAGIEDFRWHDWRHTWASWHVQSGTPLYALQEQAGWKSPDMVRRYAHLTADHFREFGERVGTNLVTPDPDSKLSH